MKGGDDMATCPGCGRELPALRPDILAQWELFKSRMGTYPCGGVPEWHDEEAIIEEEEE